ncbi:hypothetical protein G5I_03208 [Acromyrmex echinatior]|uniref:Uncharacterized protein n=1 Tax=Acromyrmex echinatior TaxID=103372 RepID=F4WCD4_ACREC|nr:hypothetical protein G5I_03208 [Acromyrmex echinatior]
MAISTCVPRIRVTRDNAPACIANAACPRCPRFLRSNLAIHWLKKFMENLFGHELVETNTTSFDKTFDVGFREIVFSSFNIEVDVFLRILKISKSNYEYEHKRIRFEYQRNISREKKFTSTRHTTVKIGDATRSRITKTFVSVFGTVATEIAFSLITSQRAVTRTLLSLLASSTSRNVRYTNVRRRSDCSEERDNDRMDITTNLVSQVSRRNYTSVMITKEAFRSTHASKIIWIKENNRKFRSKKPLKRSLFLGHAESTNLRLREKRLSAHMAH